MNIKLVVFDMAGTTIKDNQEVSKAFRDALLGCGYDVPLSTIDKLMGYKKTVAIEQMLKQIEPEKKKITDQLIDKIHNAFVGQMISHYQTINEIEPLPNVEQTFAALKANGVQVGLNTGFSRDIANTIITRLKWQEKGLIDHLVGSDEVEAGRPYPFMINKMMRDGRIEQSNEVVKVGDTEVDIREGQNAGCQYVIGITTGSFSRDELEKYHPTHIIDNITEVLDIVNAG